MQSSSSTRPKAEPAAPSFIGAASALVIRMRRVVITGMGLVTPLACGVEETWSRLLAGKSGAGPITRFKVDDLPSRIACDVPRGDGSNGSFNPDQWVDSRDQRRVDDFITYAITAAVQAVKDSGDEAMTEEENERAGVLIGSGIGGLEGIEGGPLLLSEKVQGKVSRFVIRSVLMSAASV